MTEVSDVAPGFLVWYRFKLSDIRFLTKVWPSSLVKFLMSKHMKFGEF
jgi:hypothetical protein